MASNDRIGAATFEGEAYSLPYGKPLRVYGMAKAYRGVTFGLCYKDFLPEWLAPRSTMITQRLGFCK
jgi:hypothetical protein